MEDKRLKKEELLLELESLNSRIDNSMDSLLLDFISHYIKHAYNDDFAARDSSEIFAALTCLWHIVENRGNKDFNIKVYNPEIETHGFSTGHSVIEISLLGKPFLAESIRMALLRHKYNVHNFFTSSNLLVKKDSDGKITKIAKADKGVVAKGFTKELSIFIEIDRQVSTTQMDTVAKIIEDVCEQVSIAVASWQPILDSLNNIMSRLGNSDVSSSEPQELDNKQLQLSHSLDFLAWLKENHFTFLAYDRLELTSKNSKIDLTDAQVATLIGMNSEKINELISDKELVFTSDESSVGIFKDKTDDTCIDLAKLPLGTISKIFSTDDKILILKHNNKSRIHRDVYIDIVILKEFNSSGKLIALHQFSGLFTSLAYSSSLEQMPILNQKIQDILTKKSLSHESHEAKSINHVLNNLPRDNLLQADNGSLELWLSKVERLQQKPSVDIVLQKDLLGNYFSVLVFVPREKFSAELRIKMQKILKDYLHGTSSSFTVNFSESMYNRIDFMIRVNSSDIKEVDEEFLTGLLSEATKTWYDNFNCSLTEQYGEEKYLELNKKYCGAFSSAYQEEYTAQNAVNDVKYIENLTSTNKIAISIYKDITQESSCIKLKLFNADENMALSDIVPMLELIGFKVITQNLFKVSLNEREVFLNSFVLKSEFEDFSLEDSKDNFYNVLHKVLTNHAENDRFNRLAISSDLSVREISMLRAYSKYLWQIGFSFTSEYIEHTLTKHKEITKLLVELFVTRFNPEGLSGCDITVNEQKLKAIVDKIDAHLESVENIDEDKILSRYKDLILATLRCNFYQPKNIEDSKEHKDYKDYISFKINPGGIPNMPLPLPMFEIFVYSRHVEGVHLRGGKVARGGLRWSDRKEDYRTEVLGLVKAQMVKNSVIVPTGAKGGFITKMLPENASRDEVMQEVKTCYKTFISGLLDLTDNLVADKVVKPVDTVIYDEDDTYLVVAADKGTATFSDLANEVANTYGFWLKDAFASGGSVGYDHKKMGITAKGAWESVKRSFSELSLDTQNEDFTVVAIGDMSGDVFGNGMLLSEHIKLVAAFNHMHIFIDPNPDAAVSYQERKRLFELPRSTWEDYNLKLLSKGGAIYSRKQKYIKLNQETKELLGISLDTITPNDLIKKILTAKVDLLFNGGIGTYVKAKKEHHSDIGDRANDSLRVNACELNCRVVGEGGNLGFSQLARIEYAENGGKINTDAIDNSAGVDCSDHEVNIKILLDRLIDSGDLTQKQRNSLLEEMTDDVSKLVLHNNINQTLAISIAHEQSGQNIKLHNRIMQVWSKAGKINLELEYLPSNDEMVEREKAKRCLTRPELSVLISYAKIMLKEELLSCDLVSDPFVLNFVYKEFPQILVDNYRKEIAEHPLCSEIIATRVSDMAINEMGFAFVYRLQEETLAQVEDIIKCYLVAREIFNVEHLFKTIDNMRFKLDAKLQARMLLEINRLIRRATRWLLRYTVGGVNIDNLIDIFQRNVGEVFTLLPKTAQGAAKKSLTKQTKELISEGVDKELAITIACMPWILSALDIVDLANLYGTSLSDVANIYYSIGNKLELGWLREEVKKHLVKDHWDALARASIRDDIDLHHRNLTIGIILELKNKDMAEFDLDTELSDDNPILNRWYQIVDEIKASPSADFIMYSVAIRELFNLTQLVFEKK